jgi:hypothetical protein
MCVFCRSFTESRDHLFFQCGFSRRHWRNVLRRCLVNKAVTVWDETLMWGLNALKSKSMRAILCRLVWSDIVYHILGAEEWC